MYVTIGVDTQLFRPATEKEALETGAPMLGDVELSLRTVYLVVGAMVKIKGASIM